MKMKSPAANSIHSWLPLPCSPLGSGSSALVSLALSLPHGLPFALKSPLSPSASPSLLHELLILLPLSSPFILRCFGADLAPDRTPRHLFLEFMHGGSLSNLLKCSGGGLAEPLVRRYASSIVQGLKYLHHNGIVHCDIKAQNILIGSSGVKIADFGAAKRIGSDHEDGASKSEFKGTPLWMAPEVVQGVEQGFPSDIWSLGCTLVELLQGRPPWGHISDIAAALYKVGCSEEDPPLPEAISDDATDFLIHCLHRDPKARWTASELLQHPFLCDIAAGDEVKHDQLSPRSTLDFLQSEVSDSEDACNTSTLSSLCRSTLDFLQSEAINSEDACDSNTLSSLRIQSVDKAQVAATSTAPSLKRHFTDAFNSTEREWITVKRVASCRREMKKVPFMKLGYGHVKRGCDVSLEAAEFLKNRKVVG